jgi:hypothetical protein
MAWMVISGGEFPVIRRTVTISGHRPSGGARLLSSGACSAQPGSPCHKTRPCSSMAEQALRKRQDAGPVPAGGSFNAVARSRDLALVRREVRISTGERLFA